MACKTYGRMFQAVWAVDFEFRCLDGSPPELVCMVAKEIHTGHIIRLYGDKLLACKECPFDTGKDSIVITYYGIAEANCFQALDWDPPHNHLDLWVEFRNRTNGIVPPGNCSLLCALEYFGLDHISLQHKQDMRDLILSKSEYSQEEMEKILDYCQSDVEALERLLPEMLPENTDELNRMLLRGRSMLHIARIENNGIPIDVDLYNEIQAGRQTIRKKMIERVDVDYGVYSDGHFNLDLFCKFIKQTGIEWPCTELGYPKLDKDTLKDTALKYPELEPFYQLRRFLSVCQKFDLPVGKDSRVHCGLNPFASRTGRNQPSTTRFPFSLPACMRGLVMPPPGVGLAYIDYRQQEFGIAAALSKDPNMIEAYNSGDPYLAFGKQAGRIPAHATKESHSQERELMKTVVLAVQYCMSPIGLSQKLGCIELEAEELLSLHKRTYRIFWEWVERFNNTAWFNMKASTKHGWQLNLTSNTKPRSVQNFPMQATGAEILRLACCIADDYWIKVCAPVHDALLIEAPLEKLGEDAAATYEAMRRAGAYLLDGFNLKADIKLIRYPARYQDKRGAMMWNILLQELENAKNDG